ncbi:MAG: mitochondrial fission ELM1 family protein [Kiritimatiellae bacterium]|nr:mitochondrial fission ELM1 family protein [Kiritimatiellia bacterium]
MKKVLILTDGKAGHENQSKAFSRALGTSYDLFAISFKSGAKPFSYLFDNIGIKALSLFNISSELSSAIKSKEYSAVIGTGSGTFYAAKTIAKKMNIPCGVVLFPRGYRISDFNCIFAPVFDSPPQKDNIVTIPVNLVATDKSYYDEGEKAFRLRHDFSDAYIVSVIVGGPNKCSTMSASWMKEQLEKVFAENRKIAEEKGMAIEFWVTTSRRTPADVEDVVDSFPFNYKLLFSKEKFNPIPAFVKLSNRIYVTAESTGMLSEVCTFGDAEIFALDNLNQGNHKFRKFINHLADKKMIGSSVKVDLSKQIDEARRLLKI